MTAPPGTEAWSDHFGRSNHWHIVKVNPTVKRLHELVSRYSTRTVFLLSKGTYHGPIVVRGATSCLIRGEGEKGSVVIECESDHYPTLTVDAPQAMVQLQNLDIRSRGASTSALALKQGVVQIVDCAIASQSGESMTTSCTCTLERCKLSPVPLSREAIAEYGGGGADTTTTSSPPRFAPRSIGLSVSARSGSTSIGLLDTFIEGFDIGVMFDGGVRFRCDDCIIQRTGSAGIVIGGSTNGTLRNSNLESNYAHGLVVEAEARVLVHQCTITNNGLSGALLCDNSHPTFTECLFEGNKGVRQIDLYGSTAATFKDNIISLLQSTTTAANLAAGSGAAAADGESGVGRSGSFHSSIVLNDVSDAVISNNQFRVILDNSNTSSRKTRGDDNNSNNIIQDDIFAQGQSCIVADGSSTCLVKRNTFAVVAVNRQRDSSSSRKDDDKEESDEEEKQQRQDQDTAYSSSSLKTIYGVLLGLWQTAKVQENSFDGFLEEKTLYNFDAANQDHPHQLSNWRTKTKRREVSGTGGTAGRAHSSSSSAIAPQHPTEDGAVAGSAGAGGVGGEGRSPNTATKLSSLYSDAMIETSNLTPDSTASNNNTNNNHHHHHYYHEVATTTVTASRGGGATSSQNTTDSSKPRSRPTSARGPRSGSRMSDAPIPMLKEEEVDHEDEVKELRGEIERLKARLRSSSSRAGAGRGGGGGSRNSTSSRSSNRRPNSSATARHHHTTGSSSAAGSRPSSSRASRPPSTARAHTSQSHHHTALNTASSSRKRSLYQDSATTSEQQLPATTPDGRKVIGRYAWDMEKMKLFNKMQIPLHEVRYEVKPTDVPGSIQERLHDSWLKDRQQKAHAEEAAEAMAKGMAKKLDRDEQAAMVLHLYDEQVERFTENKQKLLQRHHPKPPKKRLTQEQNNDFNYRNFTKHEEDRVELKEKLWKKHVLEADKRKYKKMTPSAIAAYSQSLYRSHADPDLVDKAAAEMHADLHVVKKRPPSSPREPKPTKDGFKPRPPPAPKSKDELETYCASLYKSHADYALAERADAVTHDSRTKLVNVAMKTARREQ